MVPSLDFLQNLTPAEIKLLTSTAAPIVLLNKYKVPNLAENIAPNLNEIGIMLPSNPLQHLLLREINQPLVMTSANPSGEPPVLDNQGAVKKLSHLADFYLCHNRDILQRADDSLVRVAFDGVETLRRARGYVPDEIVLNTQTEKNILALGSDLKNTFCLLKQNKAIVSQHIGDTANELIQQQLENNIDLFCQIYQFKPDLIAIDAHTGYFSSKVGKNLAKKFSIPYVTVLHHHAHITAVLAEHHCKEKVIGIALDGIGMGANGQLWGGECLLVEEKLANILVDYLPWRYLAVILQQLNLGVIGSPIYNNLFLIGKHLQQKLALIYLGSPLPTPFNENLTHLSSHQQEDYLMRSPMV